MLTTIDLVLEYVLLFVTTIALILGLHYNLQMFQQNGYKNGEFYSWLMKNDTRQRFLYPLALFMVVLVIWDMPVVQLIFFIITIIWTIAIIFAYALYWRTETKKKLVLTARVKRLIATIISLSLSLNLVSLGFTPSMMT